MIPCPVQIRVNCQGTNHNFFRVFRHNPQTRLCHNTESFHQYVSIYNYADFISSSILLPWTLIFFIILQVLIYHLAQSSELVHAHFVLERISFKRLVFSECLAERRFLDK